MDPGTVCRVYAKDWPGIEPLCQLTNITGSGDVVSCYASFSAAKGACEEIT